jgi:hypothetical protein
MGTSGVIAALSSALFAGGAVYINLVEHPARMSCGTEIALSEFAPSYQRATVVQVSLAVTAALAGVVAWLMTDAALWLVGAICIVAVIPFTLVFILPTNHRLLESGRDARSEETRRLLDKWARLHAVRTVLSVLASLLFLLAS